MATTAESVAQVCARAKQGSRVLATLDGGVRDTALEAMATAVENRAPEILAANARDLEAGEEAGLGAALMDRLRLDENRLTGIAHDVRAIASLPDPVGQTIDGHRLANGL